MTEPCDFCARQRTYTGQDLDGLYYMDKNGKPKACCHDCWFHTVIAQLNAKHLISHEDFVAAQVHCS